MLLKNILRDLKYKGNISSEFEVKDIAYNSKNAGQDVMFVCLVGSNSDGHNYAVDAYNKGSRVFMCERDVSLPDDAIIIFVENTRKALAFASANFFDNPSHKLNVIGVTGTKGKTSIVHMVKDMLDNCGIKCGSIGTVGACFGDKFRRTVNTTPESYEINKLLNEMVEDGCKAVAIEVSSIGVMMHRVDKIKFSISVFTNISPDHIGGDEHKTFEEYYGWKKAFFDNCDYAIGCYDDMATEDMLETVKEKVFFGLDDNADFKAYNIKPYKDEKSLGIEFDLKYDGKIYTNLKVSMPGEYSVYNTLSAIAICNKLGVQIDDMRESLKKVYAAGRTEPVVINSEYSIIIDYAHNGTSLRQVLKTMREYNPKRLICLFGSVGGRAQLRRKEMGIVAGKMCDLSIITSDDPNYEEPIKIIDEIASYVDKHGGKYVKIVDRQEAINYAVNVLETGDMLILAGKGHEKYQKVKGKLIPLDEKEYLLKAIKNKFNVGK